MINGSQGRLGKGDGSVDVDEERPRTPDSHPLFQAFPHSPHPSASESNLITNASGELDYKRFTIFQRNQPLVVTF
jgi:hypothetical protein